MVKKTFRNMAMATGLAAIVAGSSACSPMESARMRGEQQGPNMPYIVQPGYNQWNLGVGFWNLANSMPRPADNQRNSQEHKPRGYEGFTIASPEIGGTRTIYASSKTMTNDEDTDKLISFDEKRKKYIVPMDRGPPKSLPFKGAKGYWLNPKLIEKNNQYYDPNYIWYEQKEENIMNPWPK